MLKPPAQPAILVAEEDDQIAVTIIPPPAGVGHDRAFADYLSALRYAQRLRAEFGWRLVNRVDARTRLRALLPRAA